MRSLLVALLALIPSTAAHAEAPLRVGPDGLTISRSDSLPRRSYAWNHWLVGNDDVHVLVTESDRTDLPARYAAFDNAGIQLWAADHACPNFDDYTTVFEVEGRIVCKWKRQVIAVDMKTGAEAWRFSDPRPMYITAGAKDRIAVSIDNQQLAVLDAKDGREVMRIDTEGAVLESVAATKDGPLALLVWDTPEREKDTIELPTGEGGALERVELSGDDPGRKMVGLPLWGRPTKGVIAMKPRWTTPFGGYSFDLTPTGGVVVSVPRENVRAAWDLADGKLLWERPMRDDEMWILGEEGIAIVHPDDSGRYVWGAVDPRSLAPRWEKPLPVEGKPGAGGQGGGDLGLITERGFALVRFADGAVRQSLTLDPGLELSSIRSTRKSLMWVLQRDTERWLHFQTLPKL
jgi:hypothetical protein